MSTNQWQKITPDFPANKQKNVLLATSNHIIGIFSGRKTDEEGEESWWVDSSYYDGDDPPVWALVLPELPQ